MKFGSAIRSIAFITCAIITSAGIAQTSNGTIAGTITDISGAALANATVTAKSSQTGAILVAHTGKVGEFRIDSVLSGAYDVTAEADGFTKVVVSSVQVNASVVTSVNAQLKPGNTTQVVEVQGTTQTLNTDSGERSDTISTVEVQSLPVSSINPYQLAITLPGVSVPGQAMFSNGYNYSVNGGRPRSNNFLIEGQDNNDAGIHGQALQPENLDAVKEVAVLTNGYAAEYGHGGGSVANLIFKSGTNTFHGAIWDRLLNSSLNATDKGDVLNGNPKGKTRENLFGFDIGGPVIKDKLFFFASYQWDNYRATANLDPLEIPTDNGYATLQQYSYIPRVANLLQAYGTLRGSTNQQLSGYELLPLGPDPATGVDRGSVEVGRYQRFLGNSSNSPELDLKGDWLVTPHDTLTLRYNKSNFSTPIDTGNYPSQLPGFDATQFGASHNAGIVYTHVFTPAVLNEFRASYQRIGFTFDFAPSTYANPLGLSPTTSITGLTGFGAPSGDPQGRFHNNYQLQDAVSWQKGNHFIKIGADIMDNRVRDAIPFNYYGSIDYDSVSGGYSGIANYIDDFGGNNASVAQNFGNPIARPELISQNYYIQDNWKATSRLTLDIGFRYEYNGSPFNSVASPAIDLSNAACFTCIVKEQSDWSDYGPRVGFNFTPDASRKTVISGAYGIFYDGLFTNILDNIQSSAPAAASPDIISTPSNANPRGMGNWSEQFANLNKTAQPTDFAEPITPHLLSPETIQGNLGIQRELPGSMVLSVAYVATRGQHLFATTEFNPTVGGGDRLIPSRGRIAIRDNSGDSMYNSGQVNLQRRFSSGLTFRAAYTYAKFLDDTSEIFTDSNTNASTYAEQQYPARRGLDWGPSAYDVRHNFVISYVYQIPKWNAEGAARAIGAVVNGWMVSGITNYQTGAPTNIEVGTDVNGDGITNDRPVLSNPKAPLTTYAFEGSSWMGTAPGIYCDGAYAWNTNDPCHPVTLDQVHWLVPAYGTQGNVISRNSGTTRGSQNWDVSLQRTFHVWESTAFDFRGELLNVFNHGNTGIPNSTLTTGIVPQNGEFGPNLFDNLPLTVTGNRVIRFYMKLSF